MCLTNILFYFYSNLMYSALSCCVPPYICPPTPLLILTYLYCGGSDDHTADSVRLGGGRGWLDTIGHRDHPCYCYGVSLGVLSLCCGHRSHEPDLCLNDPILRHRPTTRRGHGLHIHSAAATTHMIMDSNLFHQSCASKCANFTHTPP